MLKTIPLAIAWGCALLAAVLAQTPSADALFERAVALHRSGEWRAAEAEYLKALALAPQAAQIHANLGAVLAQQGRPLDAIANYEKALALDPGLKPVLLNLGIAHFRAQQFVKAAGVLESFLAVAPGHLQARQLLGISLVEAGRDADALPHLEQAVAAAPDEMTGLYSLGLAYLHLSRSELDGVVQRLQAHSEGIALARFLRGQALMSRSEFVPAKAELEAAAQANPNLPRVQYWLGVNCLMLEERGAAQTHLEQALEQMPGDALTLYYLAFAEQAGFYFDRARQHAAAALQADPQSLQAQGLLGIILHKQGAAQDALPLLEAVVAKDPKNAEMHYYLGRVYQRLGRKQEAAREAAAADRLKSGKAEHNHAGHH